MPARGSWIELYENQRRVSERKCARLLAPSDLTLLAWFIGACMPLLLPSLPSFGLACLVVSLLSIMLVAPWIKRYRFLIVISLSCWISLAQFAQYHAKLIPTNFERQDIELSGLVIGLPKYDDQRIRFELKIAEIYRAEPELKKLVGQKTQA